MWLLLLLWPVAELYVAIKVSDAIGFLPMLLLLIVAWPIGRWAIRTQGRTAMRQLRASIAAGKTPAGETMSAALVVCGGLLVMIPGFITDVIGALFLIPVTRALFGRLLARGLRNRRFARAVSVGSFIFGRKGFSFGGFGSGGGTAAQNRDYDVDGTAVDVDHDNPRLSS